MLYFKNKMWQAKKNLNTLQHEIQEMVGQAKRTTTNDT